MDGVFLSILTNLGQKTVSLTGNSLTLGRSAENAVMIEDPQASRFHCIIERTNDGFLLRDLDSRNGTKVNGKPVKRATLKRGDVVSIGTTELRLVMPEISGSLVQAGSPQKPPAPNRATTAPKSPFVAKPMSPLIPRGPRGASRAAGGRRDAGRPSAKAPPVPRKQSGAPPSQLPPGEELRFLPDGDE